MRSCDHWRFGFITVVFTLHWFEEKSVFPNQLFGCSVSFFPPLYIGLCVCLGGWACFYFWEAEHVWGLHPAYHTPVWYSKLGTWCCTKTIFAIPFLLVDCCDCMQTTGASGYDQNNCKVFGVAHFLWPFFFYQGYYFFPVLGSY